MRRNDIWQAVELELRKAKKAYPQWPDHIVSRAAIVSEEAGELLQAALESKYEKGKKGRNSNEQVEQMRKEAVQTAAMAIRFLENLK